MNPALPISACAAIAASGATAQTMLDEWCPTDGPVVYIDAQGIGWGDHTTCETVPFPPANGPAFHASLRCFGHYATGETDADGQPEFVSIPSTAASEVTALLLPDDTLAIYVDNADRPQILTRCPF